MCCHIGLNEIRRTIPSRARADGGAPPTTTQATAPGRHGLQPARGRHQLQQGVSTPLFHDKNTQHIGKSQSKRPHKMWKRPLTFSAVLPG